MHSRSSSDLCTEGSLIRCNGMSLTLKLSNCAANAGDEVQFKIYSEPVTLNDGAMRGYNSFNSNYKLQPYIIVYYIND